MSSSNGATYRWVLRTYPKEYREVVGGELVDTANQLSGGRWSPRQSLGLVAGGLRTRERFNNDGDWLLSAAHGVGLALLIQSLVGGLARGLVAAGMDLGPGGLVVGAIPSWVSAVLAMFVAVLLVRSTKRPTLLLITVLFLGVEIVSTVLSPEFFSVSRLWWIAWPLVALWFVDRFGDGRGLLSVPTVALLAIALVLFAVVAGDPFLVSVAIPGLVALGLFSIRLRPTWAFAALALVARGSLNPVNVSLVELGIFTATLGVIGLIGWVAVRSVRRLSDV